MTKNRESPREAAARIRRLADQADSEEAARALRRYALELDRRVDRDEAVEASRRRLKEIEGN